MLKHLKGDDKKIIHTYGVLERSLELGKLYNANLEVLKISSYFHDITKNLTNLEHEKLINNKVLFENIEPFMYHAYSAYSLALNYNIEDEKILEAIKYHIWGKIEMNLETMILCVSDYCEKNRTHIGAKEVYQLALKNIYQAYLLSIKKTMDYNLSLNNKLNPEQIKVYNYYKEKYGTIK